MRLLFIINTPGQAHTWKHVISNLLAHGHVIKIIARDYDSAPEILRNYGFQFDTFQAVGSRLTRLLGAFTHFEKCFQLSRNFSPSIVIGFGIDAAVTATRMHTPSVVFIDDDQSAVQNFLTRMLGSTIITPDCFRGELGNRHIRIKGYKELAYLHPNYFTPDASVFEELNLARGEKYIILRFSSGDAVHDITYRSLALCDKLAIVETLKQHARVFISPEGPLPDELTEYRLPVPCHRFHHALYYAHMFVSDTGTSASEAAILGTPAVLCGSDSVKMGNFESLNGYDLLYSYDNAKSAIAKASDLIQRPRLKEDWAAKSKKLLSEKIDVCRFLSDFIHNFPAGNDNKVRNSL